MAPEPTPLDNVVWQALTSHQRALAERAGRARRYPPAVSVFAAVDEFDAEAWADLAELIGPGGHAALFRDQIPLPPEGWEDLRRGAGHQMVLEGLGPEPDSGRRTPPERSGLTLRRLTTADVAAMTDLVALTEPGPFGPRTIEMGRYHGYLEGDRLVAMAGERVHLDRYTEISAVCTHPDAQGRGLASALVRRVAGLIIERDETPILHVAAGNDNARRLYEHLGFTTRRMVEFALVQAPG